MEAQQAPRLSIKQIEIGPMANYVYVIADRLERKAMLVDPAWDIGALLATFVYQSFGFPVVAGLAMVFNVFALLALRKMSK